MNSTSTISNRQSRHVLTFAEYGSINGGENSFLTAATVLAQRGWHYTVAVPIGTEFEAACRSRGFETLEFKFTDSAGLRKSQAAIRESASRVIRQVLPDLVHCNSLSTGRLLGPVTSNEGIPSLGYLRDILKLSRTAIADLNQLDRLVAVSKATKQFHVKQGLSETSSVVIYNGVDLTAFRPGATESRVCSTRSANSPKRILFVGQIGMRKGIETLLEAVEICSEHVTDLDVQIVGQRHSQKLEAIEYELELHRTATAIESTGRVKFHWLGRRNDVAELMRGSDLLVHPAKQEPLGRVLLEAFASGLPVVASDVGGTPEIFAGLDDWDLLCHPNDPTGLAERIQRVLASENPGLREQVRAIAESRFPIATTAEKLESEYLNLLANA